MATNLPNFGLPNSPLNGVSMGNGSGTGLGSGNGSGIGPGSGGNMGGGPRRIGGGVSAPQVLYARWSLSSQKKARKAKFAGNVSGEPMGGYERTAKSYPGYSAALVWVWTRRPSRR